MTDQQQKLSAFHESGHGAAAMALAGWTVDRLTIVPDPATGRVASIEASASYPECTDALQIAGDQIVVHLAGPQTEALYRRVSGLADAGEPRQHR